MKDTWEECAVEVQALMIAFDQISSHDDASSSAQLFGSMFGGK